MKIPIILTVSLLTSSCKDKLSYSSNSDPSKDTAAILNFREDVTTGTMSRPINYVIYETENIRLFGDTTINRDKIFRAVLKFEPYIGFEDFKVDIIDHKKHADLDLESNVNASNFRTRLKEEYSADTANFAGHYSFVYWGCGSPCQSSLLIDRQTGKIYDSPGASLGYEYHSNSRMLLINPPDTSGFYDDCPYCKPTIYVFDEKTKKFTEKKPKK